MAIPPRPQKNIWVAAGDGDLDRVRELIEHEGVDPNAPDPYTYTPMHAAASYGHLHVLDYLISRGGNIDITDSDGDTPLYTAETVSTAQYLVEHGANIGIQNSEGISPIDHLQEDFPEVASFLQSLSPSTNDTNSSSSNNMIQQPSQHAQNIASESLTSALLSSIQQLQSQSGSEEPSEEEIRRVVSDAVLQGVRTGFEMGNEAAESGPSETNPSSGQRRPASNSAEDDESQKRRREDVSDPQ